MASLAESGISRVGDFVPYARELDAAGFAERFPHPFLHVIMSELSEDDAEFFTEAVGEDDLAEMQMRISLRKADPDAVVYAVVKRWGANPFAGMVTVGRAKNCDLVIQSRRISKFHCFFRGRGDGADGFVVGDAGSRNGTKLNGERLEKSRPVSLQSGDRIDLGDVLSFNFLSAADFRELII